MISCFLPLESTQIGDGGRMCGVVHEIRLSYVSGGARLLQFPRVERVGRPANRHRVLRAARILGYLPLEGAVALPSRPARLKYLIPYGANPFMHEVADTIRRFAREQPLVARCDIIVLEGIGPEPQEAGLERLSRDTDGVGVITTDHPRSREALGRLCAAGVRVAT